MIEAFAAFLESQGECNFLINERITTVVEHSGKQKAVHWG